MASSCLILSLEDLLAFIFCETSNSSFFSFLCTFRGTGLAGLLKAVDGDLGGEGAPPRGPGDLDRELELDLRLDFDLDLDLLLEFDRDDLDLQ